MKETVLSAKTSGTARKRFEVIVEVIKKNPPPFFFFFFTLCFFLLSRNLFGFRGAGHIFIYTLSLKKSYALVLKTSLVFIANKKYRALTLQEAHSTRSALT